MKKSQAIILAGGKGTRLLPYTAVLPKPLVPIGERPILEIIVRQLKNHGFTRLTFAVNHLAELIQAFFGDGSKWGVEITYSREEEPIGTAGPIALVENVEDDFLVMNGDVLTSINYDEFMMVHHQQKSLSTVATYAKKVPISLGVLNVSADGELLSYTEKPILHYDVSTGIYAFNRRILKFIPQNRYLDLPDLMRQLIGHRERVYCYKFEGSWLDIGNPDDFQTAAVQFEQNQDIFLPKRVAAHV